MFKSEVRLVSALLVGSGVLALLSPSALAGGAPATGDIPTVTVIGASQGLVGVADSASEGTVLKVQLEERPVYRVGELLETVPGLIVTQHSGEGKANQYFLRGFNLDHGTDLEITVDGMPANLCSHAHGQGYADLNFFIPELASGIVYRKGTHAAEEGDFATAGAVHVGYLDRLDHDLASVSFGTLGDQRLFGATSRPVGSGDLMIAGEFVHLDGPFTIPDDFRKVNGFARYAVGSANDGYAVTAMYLRDAFHATNQIPERALKDGRIGAFDAIDPSDAGDTERYSLSGRYARALDGGQLKASAYVIGYHFRLFNDFTYFLDFPIQGDQFKQQDNRMIYGGQASYSAAGNLFGLDAQNTIGFEVRDDQAHVTLARTASQVQRFVVRDDRVTEFSSGLYAENRTQLLPWLRSVAGLRGDIFYGADASDNPVNSGDTSKGRISPKLNVIFGPWAETEFYASAGRGFHSNDVRGALSQIDPNAAVLGGTPARTGKAPLLTPATGAEIGIRSGILPHLQATLSLFQLDIDSELIFSGDAGATSAGRPSRRQGIEASAFYTPLPWLIVDADFTFSRARFTSEDPVGSYIPGSPKINASLGLTIDHLDGWDGGAQFRYFGPRPLIEDGSVRSGPTAIVNLRGGYQLTESVKLQLDIFNLFDSHAHQIDYYYASRLPGEPADGVNDVHFHPAEPLSARVTVSAKF